MLLRSRKVKKVRGSEQAYPAWSGWDLDYSAWSGTVSGLIEMLGLDFSFFLSVRFFFKKMIEREGQKCVMQACSLP
jgi:hypothetical protein